MGKKGGKKKQKITGTPDVVKFKQTREFALLQQCALIQESMPFLNMDPLDAADYRKIARFLNIVGLLGEHLGIESKKDYRFSHHHPYLSPVPQYFPFGFDVDCIRQARALKDAPAPTIEFNNVTFEFPKEVKERTEKFLNEVDSYVNSIATQIDKSLADDFLAGLKRFKGELKETIMIFDTLWVEFENEYLEERLKILKKVFKPVHDLVISECQLSRAEERLDIEAKQKIENDFIGYIEEFTNTCFPETIDEKFPDDVIPLAEACVFYESKCTEEWLSLAKHLIKEYIELRFYIQAIPENRLSPDWQKNTEFMRLLQKFHVSVLAAREALEFVAKLPKLIHAKTDHWMTKPLLDPDIKYYNKISSLAAN